MTLIPHCAESPLERDKARKGNKCMQMGKEETK
jgi:hypothetical protein